MSVQKMDAVIHRRKNLVLILLTSSITSMNLHTTKENHYNFHKRIQNENKSRFQDHSYLKHGLQSQVQAWKRQNAHKPFKVINLLLLLNQALHKPNCASWKIM